MKVIIPNRLDLLSSSISESDAADGVLWDAATAYSEGQKVRHDHVSCVSLVSNNKGKIPSENWSGIDTVWKKLEATGPYKMLDDFVETQTTAPAGQTLSFCVSFDRADAFALLNMSGMESRISITDLDDNELIWTSGGQLVADIYHLSLYEYNYLPLVTHSRFSYSDLPMPIHGKLCVEIDPYAADQGAALGHIIAGRQHTLGWTEYEAELGFTDYSRKIVDDFGVTTFVRRSSADNISLPIYLHPDQMDYVAQVLREVRGMPALWIGDNSDSGKECLTQYGWLEDFRMVYTGPNEIRLSLEIQGLI